jgi:hypothetical protein
LEKRAEQALPGSKGRREGEGRGKRWPKQCIAHMNKCINNFLKMSSVEKY